MHISMNELSVMVRKAAIGAGWPQGAAEDLAAAAAILAAEKTNWGPHILAALDRPPGAEAAALDIALAEGAAEAPAPDPVLFRAYAAAAGRAYRCGVAVQIDKGIARIERREDAPPLQTPPDRVEADPVAWSTLTALAAKTYVPASEASRAAGAGAGQIDND